MFKQSFDTPPHRYLTNRRIERAKSLLAARKLSVIEIGLNVGFSETSSFTSAFRKVTGETPTDYRRRVDSSRPNALIAPARRSRPMDWD